MPQKTRCPSLSTPSTRPPVVWTASSVLASMPPAPCLLIFSAGDATRLANRRHPGLAASGRGPAAVDGQGRAGGRGPQVADQVEQHAGQMWILHEALVRLGGEDHLLHHPVLGDAA